MASDRVGEIRARLHQLHSAFNILIRLQGGSAPQCTGDDCAICIRLEPEAQTTLLAEVGTDALTAKLRVYEDALKKLIEEAEYLSIAPNEEGADRHWFQAQLAAYKKLENALATQEIPHGD